MYAIMDSPWLCVFICISLLVLLYGLHSYIHSEDPADVGYHNGYDDPEITEEDLDDSK